jgi:hypothetical protein
MNKKIVPVRFLSSECVGQLEKILFSAFFMYILHWAAGKGPYLLREPGGVKNAWKNPVELPPWPFAEKDEKKFCGCIGGALFRPNLSFVTGTIPVPLPIPAFLVKMSLKIKLGI